MFFLLLCAILWALFAFQSPFDTFGWLMLVALAWVFGFLDCKLAKKSDAEKGHTFPPDMAGEIASGVPQTDASLFEA